LSDGDHGGLGGGHDDRRHNGWCWWHLVMCYPNEKLKNAFGEGKENEGKKPNMLLICCGIFHILRNMSYNRIVLGRVAN
jgi:hypothetical protein